MHCHLLMSVAGRVARATHIASRIPAGPENLLRRVPGAIGSTSQWLQGDGRKETEGADGCECSDVSRQPCNHEWESPSRYSGV